MHRTDGIVERDGEAGPVTLCIPGIRMSPPRSAEQDARAGDPKAEPGRR